VGAYKSHVGGITLSGRRPLRELTLVYENRGRSLDDADAAAATAGTPARACSPAIIIRGTSPGERDARREIDHSKGAAEPRWNRARDDGDSVCFCCRKTRGAPRQMCARPLFREIKDKSAYRDRESRNPRLERRPRSALFDRGMIPANVHGDSSGVALSH